MNTELTQFEDNALIEMTIAGQTECFDILMQRHAKALRQQIGWRLGNPADADDVFQDVLLKVWRHLPSFRGDSTFRTWLTRVAINEVTQCWRKHRNARLSQAPVALDSFPSPAESPNRSLLRAETTQVVRKAVRGLPLLYRQAVELRDLEETSTREAAAWIGVNVPTLKTRIFRARYMLSGALRQKGFAS